MDTKSFLTSKTLWGLLIAALPMLLATFGLKVTDTGAFSDLASETVDTVIQIVGLVMAAWGRISANKQLVVKSSKTTTTNPTD